MRREAHIAMAAGLAGAAAAAAANADAIKHKLNQVAADALKRDDVTLTDLEKAPRAIRRREQLLRRKRKRKQYAHDKPRVPAQAHWPVWGVKPKGGKRSKYKPHQSTQERMRRREQIAKAELKANRFRVESGGK